MQIIIAGDLVPTKSNIELFNNGNIEDLLGRELMDLWYSADMRIINLEAPITNSNNKILKNGPHLNIPLESLKGITDLKPSLLNLANNHILDHGVVGLHSTQTLLEKNNIDYIGVGLDLKKATKPYIVDKGGKKIGIYACAENEFSIAKSNEPGANPFDPLESLDHIVQLRDKCDYLIILYHGGKEHYRYPSPYLQKVCRKMVEKGADLIICQHSHCIGSYEKYKDSMIIYGQGNFIFNEHDNEFWNNSLLINIEINDNVSISYIPVITTRQGIILAPDKQAKEIIKKFHQRSSKILEDDFIEKKYAEFAEQSINNYMSKLLGFSKWQSRIDRRIFNGYLLKRKINKNYLLAIENYVKCEAHRELLLKGIKGKRNNL